MELLVKSAAGLAAIAARDGWTDVVAYVQRMVDDHCAAGDAMVASAGDATLLQKAKAAPKELRDQIDAVTLTVEAGVPIT